ncbi:MAG: site-2 protease family protein [Patescibacteria group bacterium]|jgi:Zn-dependent protease
MFLLNLLQNPIFFVVFLVALVVAITVHEYAHALVANRLGDSTPKYMGRVTLNPLAHLDPLGTLFLFIAGFGWGKPVPINPRNFRKREDEIKVALAGIIANILMAIIIGIPIRIAILQGIPIESSTFLSVLNFAVEINIVLAAFNLLPIYPLDGSHLIEYLLHDSPAIQYYREIGPYLLFIMVFLGRTSGLSVISIILEPLMRVLSFIAKGTFSLYSF